MRGLGWITGQLAQARNRGARRFKRARDRGCASLLPRQRPDGSITAYAKALSAFQVCGYGREAERLCSWLRKASFSSDHTFDPPRKADPSHNYIYPASWIVLGSHRLGQFDVSQKAMDFVLRFRDGRSGGFYTSEADRDEDAKQELIYVGFCGLAALYAGREEAARGVGAWMRNLLLAQPDFPRTLYTVHSNTEGLHTRPAADEQIRYVVSSEAVGDQFFFQPGVAGAFLARLFQATGESEWLQLAIEYMRFAEGANDHLFRSLRAGKVGWAAAVLYTLTEEKKYGEMAARIGDHLVATQSREGYWYGLDGNKRSNGVTAEMVVWLDEIDRSLGR